MEHIGAVLARVLEGMMERPKRAHTLEINIGADTIKDLEFALLQIAMDFRQGTRECVSGSPSVGWSIEYQHRPEMTHEAYFEAIEKMKEENP